MTTSIRRDILPLEDGNQLRYSLYREANDKAGRIPLLICLHPGWDGQIPSPHYGEHFLSAIFIPAFAQTGAVIAAPDCPGGSWNNQKSKAAILELLDNLIDRHRIDQTRVSIVGYSAGGWGAWYLLLDSAEKFSSAIMFATLPVIDPADNLMENFSKSEELILSRLDEWTRVLPPVPITMIHSRADELLPYAKARLAYQALLNDHRQVQFDTVEGVGHFEADGYIGPLRTAVPWLIETWNL
jgi:predicted peptidase